MSNEEYRPPHRLQTRRLTLRPSCVEDAGAIFETYATDPEVVRYMGWRPHQIPADTAAYLERCDAKREAGTDFAFVIENTMDRGLLGVIDVHLTRQGGARMVSFGYVIRRDRWGEGIASEALGALVDHALDHPTIFRTHAVCDLDNPASARVMEKAGMVREGVLRRYFLHPNVSDEPRDCIVRAKVR